MKYFGLYCKDVARHFWVLMSCAVFTILAIYVAATNRGNQWVFQASIVVSVILLLFASYTAWKDRYLSLIESRESLAALARRIADTGPTLDLKVDRGATTRFGFMIYADKEVCGLKIKSIQAGNCTLSGEVRSTVSTRNGEQVTLRIEIRDPKKGFISGSAGTWASALYTEECWAAFKGHIPLEIEYWDKRGNQYSVVWNLSWEKEFTSVMGDVTATCDPASYRLLNA